MCDQGSGGNLSKKFTVLESSELIVCFHAVLRAVASLSINANRVLFPKNLITRATKGREETFTRAGQGVGELGRECFLVF